MPSEPVCAWAVLGAWRGSKLLLAQLIDQVGRTARGEPGVCARVYTEGEYDERFDSGDEFVARASTEVLARLTAVEVTAGDPGELSIHLRLQKDQYPRHRWPGVSYPRSGAVVTVQGPDADEVMRARDRMVAALRQGNLGRWPAPTRGEGGGPDAPRRALLARGIWSDVGDIAVAAVFLPFLAVLLVSISVRQRPCEEDPTKDCTSPGLDVPSGSDLLIPVIAGLVLAGVAGFVRYRRPSFNPALWILAPVEIADQSTARKALRVLYGLATAVVPVASLLTWGAVKLFG